MADPARFDRPREAAGDVLLADEFLEPLRAIPPCDHLVARRGGCAGVGN
jgi:hypothetical protein